MKIETNYNDSVSTLSGFDMKVDGESNELLMYILSQGYSDPIGSIVREYSTNAIDAHIEAGKMDEPIVIHVDDSVFQVQDFGTGMDKERITNVFCKFLGSTKRDTNEIHGGFGLGAKSALAYRDHFMIYTVKDNYHHRLVMRKGNNSIRLETISEGYTDEINGTKITVPLLSVYDKSKFVQAMKDQLAYFDNVTFTPSTRISNDFKLYEGKHFKVSSLAEENKPTILLGSVNYPSSNKLSSWYGWPIALKFDIGDLKVTPYRESIIYDDIAIEKIKEKFELAKKEITEYAIELYNESISDAKEYMIHLFQYQRKGVKLFDKTFSELSVPKKSYSKFKYIKSAHFYQDSVIGPLDAKLQSYYTLDHTNNGRRSREYVISKSTKGWNLRDMLHNNDLNLICTYPNTKWSTVTNKYLTRTFNKSIRIFNIKRKRSLWKHFYLPLQLNEYPRSQWRGIINEYLEFERDLFNEIVFYDDIIVPEEFRKQLNSERKKSIQKRKTSPNVKIKVGRKGQTYPYLQVFDISMKLDDVYNFREVRKHSPKGIIIHHDINVLRNLHYLFTTRITNSHVENSHFAVALVNKKVYKQLETSQFLIKYDDFISNYSRHLSKLCTALIISNWFGNIYRKIPNFNNKLFEVRIPFYSDETRKLLDKLQDYVRDNMNHRICDIDSRFIYNGREYHFSHLLDKHKDLIDIAEKNNWWDKAALDDLNKFKNLVFDFLPVGQTNFSDPNSTNCGFLVEYFKLKKIKLNKSFYNL